jgi:hypothetical protein
LSWVADGKDGDRDAGCGARPDAMEVMIVSIREKLNNSGEKSA